MRTLPRKGILATRDTARNGCSIAAELQTKSSQRPHSRAFADQRRQASRADVCVSDEALPLFRSNSTGTARAPEPPGERRRRCAAQDAGQDQNRARSARACI